MLQKLSELRIRLARKGFTGPHYQGLRGKIRFALESVLARKELVFALSADDFRDPGADGRSDDFTVVRVHTFEEMEEWREALERLWYPGITDSWRGPFRWGQRAYLGLLDGAPVSFNFLQEGNREGATVYWGRVLEDEYRILRGGVAPSMRGRRLNTAMKGQILAELFEKEGATRVYAECYEANVPSVRTLRTLGFRIIGGITVIECGRWGPLVVWGSADRVVD